MFIGIILIGGIRPILIHRFPETGSIRFSCFIDACQSQRIFQNRSCKFRWLIQVKVIILNDKSDFNEMIFSEKSTDPNDLFEELVLDKREDEEDERDNMEGVFKEDKDTLEYDSVEKSL